MSTSADTKELVRRYLNAFNERDEDTLSELLAEDDTVAVRYTVRGTHTGEYRDIEPTGHTAKWTGLAIYRVEDDEIAEIWLEEDRLGLLEQLEVVDPPAHLRV